ncbi:MAG: radical SAM protein [Deltaproteobacteria bacterium]|nr:radical SAM protein [Deltaproteobacteria bacterium]
MGTHRDPSFSSSATLADAAFYRDHGYWPVPQLVQWMVTQRCSLDCAHCLAKDGAATDELTLDEARELIDQLAELGVPELLLTGGEPLERPDLPRIIERLAERRLHWSLNTAVYPSEDCLAAMRMWPPSFVAVSLDGPEGLHDRFRGRAGTFADALRAIRCYAELTDGAVTAGTTVTRESFGRLDETFRAVVESGATGWGIHLVFPEGRAAQRPDLQLTRQQARDLIEFVASRRQHFPVTLADEIGYCGEWEPLVRDAPFHCGAGRAQCVVLADGHVVPCSTTDHAVSAGTIRERPLAALWRDGFAELRDHRPEERCGSCEYLSVCGGGCWLQRRHGLECLRPVWHRPSALANAAGVAVCLGLAACGGGDPTPAQTPSPGTSPQPSATAATPLATAAASGAPTTAATAPLPEPGFDADLVRCMVATLGPGGTDGMALKRLQSRLTEDPAKDEILALVQQERPPELAERVKQVTAAQKTQQRSLTLASLLWRDVASWALDCTPPEDRTDEERRLLRDTLTQLEATTAAWRLEIVRRKLDPFFVRSDATAPIFMMTKALRKRASVGGHSELAFKHWGTLPSPATAHQLTKQFLDRHPFALNFRLTLSPSKGSPLKRITVDPPVLCSARCAVDVFNVIATPPGTGTTVVKVTFGTHRLELDGDADPKVKVATVPGRELSITLPLGVELTHADLLRLGYEQNFRTLGSARRTPFELPALRKRLLQQLAKTPQNPGSVDAARWDLLRVWLF